MLILVNFNTQRNASEILENLVVRMVPYISKVNQNKEFATGLLLEELNVKEFDKPHNVAFCSFSYHSRSLLLISRI
jgi:hypothetical protein